MAEVRTLFSAPDLCAGEFVCRPDDVLWREENWIGRGHHVAFPRHPVWINRNERLLATPNHAVLYNDGDYYTRKHAGDHGDHSFFLIVGESLMGDLTRDGRFGRPDGFVSPLQYAKQWCAARMLRRKQPDELAVHEALLEVLAGVCASGERRARSRHDAVEAVKLVLAESAGTSVRLEELASMVHLSPFHLARQFRAATGYTIRGFRTQLRLRSALDELERGRRLADVALDLGFSSHSHFTDTFRRSFGVAPSAVRRGDVGALRKNLEAGARLKK